MKFQAQAYMAGNFPRISRVLREDKVAARKCRESRELSFCDLKIKSCGNRHLTKILKSKCHGNL